MNKLLNLIVTLENILSTYRNYTCLNKITKLLVCTRIVFEITLIIASITIVYSDFNNDYNFHFIITHVYSIYVILIALCHSKRFKLMLIHIKTCSDCFSKTLYIKKTNIRTKILMYVLFCYLIINLAEYIMYYFLVLTKRTANKDSLFIIYLYFLEVTYCVSEFRYNLEFGVVWSVYISIADQLKCLVDLITKEAENKQMIAKEMSYVALNRNKRIYRKWTTTYEIIGKIASLCNGLFYWQVCLYNIFYVAWLFS